MNSRFWIMLADDESQPGWVREAGWWGIVDEEAGGIIAYAATEDSAAIIRDTFNSRTR